jgi:Ca2+-binding RTX toxin-like protein
VGNTINGTAAAETLTGTAGDDAISGLLGNDTINAGAGDDTITWNANQTGATDGRDFVDGGAGVDTVVVTTRVLGIETYRIYTRAAAIAAGITPQNANTEIVITRGQAPLVGTTVYTPILELDNIEEIVIGTNNVTAPTNGVPNAGGAGLGDTVQVFGDFSTTSLLLNTITINGTSGADTVDIAALTSAHRIVFRTAGGNDIVVGTLRPQDVIQVPDGVDPAAYVATDNGDGTVTMATGTHSVTFTGSINALPTLAPGGVAPEGNMGDVDAGQHAGDENGSGAESGVNDGNDGASDDRDADADHSGAGLVLMPSETAGVHVGDAGDDVILGGDQGDAQIGKGGADVLIGNGGDDAAVGGSGDDVIEGGAGRDVLLGAAGNDHFIAQSDDGADLIFGGEGSDTLDLSALIDGAVIDLGAYTPIGTVRADGVTDHLIGVENVIGTQGADVIKAALGINILTGDDGDDLFVFVSAGAADGDVITDFRPGDRIDLSGIDAMVGTNGNQAFTLAEMGMTAAGSLVIHEVATADGVDTIIDGYTDADDDADFSLTLHGAHDLSGAFTF